MAAAATQAAEKPGATEKTITAAAAKFQDQLPSPSPASEVNGAKQMATQIRNIMGATRGMNWKRYLPPADPISNKPPWRKRSRSRSRASRNQTSVPSDFG
jgi:hypothetical protein